MKKKLFAGILAFVLLFLLLCPVQAAYDGYVIDLAEEFSTEETALLTEKAQALTEKYGCAVYCVILDRLDGYEAWEYNQALLEEWELGYGSDQSCVILLVSVEERQYDIMAHGYGNTAFTDYGKDCLAEYFLPSFAADNWFEGFVIYLDQCEFYLQQAAEGNPVDVEKEKGKNPVFGVLTGIGIPAAVASIVCSVFKSQMKTANLQTDANAYKAGKGLVLTRSKDTYTHTTREKKTNKDAEDGGTTVDHKGSSHKSGNF